MNKPAKTAAKISAWSGSLPASPEGAQPATPELSCGSSTFKINISVIGIGMGNDDTLTVGGAKAIEQADLILGAGRMIEPFRKKYPQKKYVQEYLSSRILDAIREEAEAKRVACSGSQAENNGSQAEASGNQAENIGNQAEASGNQAENIGNQAEVSDAHAEDLCNHAKAFHDRAENFGNHAEDGELRAAVLYSGDCGFYSGAVSLRKALDAWTNRGPFTVELRQYAGISSFSYFSAALGVSYAQAAFESWHGHSDDRYYEAHLIKTVREKEQTFLLLSGIKDVNRLGRVLMENALEACEIFLGYQLGSAREKIFRVTPAQAETLETEGLYIAMIRNAHPGKDPLIKVLPDDAFLRDKTPMTKEEIRHLSILKLGFTPNAVFYDIGAGTGSVSCEAAGLDPSIQVYAIEQKETAAQLLEKNIAQLHLANVTVVRGKAPDAMEDLPAPTHAFIGGSSGQLQSILESLRRKCPGIRVVVNAISLETLSEIMACAKTLQFAPEMVQIQASRSHEVGAYHLVKAENPIWIAAFNV